MSSSSTRYYLFTEFYSCSEHWKKDEFDVYINDNMETYGEQILHIKIVFIVRQHYVAQFSYNRNAKFQCFMCYVEVNAVINMSKNNIYAFFVAFIQCIYTLQWKKYIVSILYIFMKLCTLRNEPRALVFFIENTKCELNLSWRIISFPGEHVINVVWICYSHLATKVCSIRERNWKARNIF